MQIVTWWYTEGAKEMLRKMMVEIRKNLKKYYLRILYENLNAPLYGHDSMFEMFLAIVIRRAHFLIVLMFFLVDSFIHVLLCGLWVGMPVMMVFYFVMLMMN
jgi:hypothetical protein